MNWTFMESAGFVHQENGEDVQPFFSSLCCPIFVVLVLRSVQFLHTVANYKWSVSVMCNKV